MQNDKENSDWKKEVPYIAGLSKGNPFAVPEGYFETLSERIQALAHVSELTADQTSLQEGRTAGHSFKVPPGYFENLSDRIQSRVSIEDLREQAGHGGFVVPESYFDNLGDRIAAKAGVNNSPSIVKLFQSNFFKYSAAACLVLMSGVLLYVNDPAPAPTKLVYTEAVAEQILFDIDEEVIIEHIENGSDETADRISDKELEAYILSNFSQNDLTSE